MPGLAGGRYVILGQLGVGGMARVWKAQDTLLHRDVAIKEILPKYGLTEAERRQARDWALREARAMVRVDHPNVVRVHDVIDAGADPLIVMEYVPGRNLRQVLDDTGPLDLETTARIGSDVLDALRAAHREGVLHRDVKPANILIRPDRRIVLTDFGIAKLVGYHETTHSGPLTGTPAYLAPERVREQDASAAGDLWALGVTLYACLTGDSPFFRSEVFATLLAVAEQEADIPATWGALGPVIECLLRKDPAARPDVEETARLLRQARQSFSPGRASVPTPDGKEAPALPLDGKQDPAAPFDGERTSVPPFDGRRGAALPPMEKTMVFEASPAPSSGRRVRRVVLGLVAVLVLLVGAGAALWWQRRPLPDPQLQALEALAGKQPVASCEKIGPLDNQATRRECQEPGHEVYWILYGRPTDDVGQAAKRRDDQYAADVRLRKDNSPPCTCQIHQGAGPDGSRSRYVEYTYHASDDNRDWAAVWWDDDISHPDGRAALNIRRPYDRADSDPAAPLRALWQSWGYRFTDE
jgi:serine/threonine protein kinase